MLSALPTPVLAVTADAVRDLEGREALSGLWALFTKCKDSLQDGRRLENISWRLWYREILISSNTGGQVEGVQVDMSEKSLDPFVETVQVPPPDYSVGSFSSARSSISLQQGRPSSIRSRRGSFISSVSVGKIICDMLPSASISTRMPASLSLNQISSTSSINSEMRHLPHDPKIEAIEHLHHPHYSPCSISGSGVSSSTNSTLVHGAYLQTSCSSLSIGSEPSISLAHSPIPPVEDFTQSLRPTTITMPSAHSSPSANQFNANGTILGASCLPTPQMEVGQAEANILSIMPESTTCKTSNEDERRPYTGPPSPSLSDSYATAHPGEVEAQEQGLLPSLSPVLASSQLNASIPSATPSHDDTSTEPTISPMITGLPTLAMPTTTILPITDSHSSTTAAVPSTAPRISSSTSNNFSAPPQPPRLVVVNPTPNPTPHPTPPATPLIPGAIGFPHGLVHGTGAGAAALLQNKWLLPPRAIATVERSQRRKAREEAELNRREGEGQGAGDVGDERRRGMGDAEQGREEGKFSGKGRESEGGWEDCREQDDNEECGNQPNKGMPSVGFQRPVNRLSVSSTASSNQSNTTTASGSSSTNTTSDTSVETGGEAENKAGGGGWGGEWTGFQSGSRAGSDNGASSGASDMTMTRIPSLSTIDSSSTMTYHHHQYTHRSRASFGSGSGSGSSVTPPPPSAGALSHAGTISGTRSGFASSSQSSSKTPLAVEAVSPTTTTTTAKKTKVKTFTAAKSHTQTRKKPTKRNSVVSVGSASGNVLSIVGGVLSASPSEISISNSEGVKSPGLGAGFVDKMIGPATSPLIAPATINPAPVIPATINPPVMTATIHSAPVMTATRSMSTITSTTASATSTTASATSTTASATSTTSATTMTTTTKTATTATKTAMTTTTTTQKRRSVAAGGALVRRPSSGAGSSRSRSAGRSRSREPMKAAGLGLEMTMAANEVVVKHVMSGGPLSPLAAVMNAGGGPLSPLAAVVNAAAAGSMTSMSSAQAQAVAGAVTALTGAGGARKAGGGVKGRSKFGVGGGKLVRTRSVGAAGAHARRTSTGSSSGLGLVRRYSHSKPKKEEEDGGEDEQEDFEDEEGEVGEEDEEEPVKMTQQQIQQEKEKEQAAFKLEQQQREMQAIQAKAMMIMEQQLKAHKESEAKRAEMKRQVEREREKLLEARRLEMERDMEEKRHLEILAEEKRLEEEEEKRVAAQRKEMAALQGAMGYGPASFDIGSASFNAMEASMSFAGRRAARFNIGSNSDDGSGLGGKSTGSGSDAAAEQEKKRKEEEMRMNVQPYGLHPGPTHQLQQQQLAQQVVPDHRQLAFEYQQRQLQQQLLQQQQQQQQQQQHVLLQQQQAAQLQQIQQQQSKQKQYDEQFIRQLSKSQLAQLQKMQQLQGLAGGLVSRQGSAKHVGAGAPAPGPFAPLTAMQSNGSSKGKEKQREHVADHAVAKQGSGVGRQASMLGRQVSTSSKGKERAREYVKSVSPKKPGKHARIKTVPLDATELETRVNESLAEPLLPQGNKKTIVLTSDESEYSTDEWSSEDNDEEELRREKEQQKERDVEAKKQQQLLLHAQQLLQQQQQQVQQQNQQAHQHQPARPAFQRNHSSHYPAANNARGKQLTRKQAQMVAAQANTQLLVEQAARELREIQKREEREQEQRDMFKKLPSESFQNLAAARTRSVGLLTQLMNPDPTIFPPNHPYRRGHSSGEIRQPTGIAALKPMTKLEERPAQLPQPGFVQPPDDFDDVPELIPLDDDEIEAPEVKGPKAPVVAPPQPPVIAAPKPPAPQPPVVAAPQPSKHPLAQLGRPRFQPPLRSATMSKSPVAQPVQSIFNHIGSFASKAGALVGMAPLIGTGGSNGYRPRGKPAGEELETDSEGEEDQVNTTQMSKSVAHEKLMALARRGNPAAPTAGPSDVAPAMVKGAPAKPLPGGDAPPLWARAAQLRHSRNQSQSQASTSRVPQYAPAPIPVGHPYNLPPAAPPSTPTTTRRVMVSHEISESLRANMIHERQVSRGPDPAVLRRTASYGPRILPSAAIPNMVKLHAKGTINPADLPAPLYDDRDKEARKQTALQRTASLADDYHIAGW